MKPAYNLAEYDYSIFVNGPCRVGRILADDVDLVIKNIILKTLDQYLVIDREDIDPVSADLASFGKDKVSVINHSSDHGVAFYPGGKQPVYIMTSYDVLR